MLPDFMVHEDGKFVSCTPRPPLPPRKYSWYSFLLEVESTPGPQCVGRNMTMKNSMIPLGIEPMTCWLAPPRALKYPKIKAYGQVGV